MVASDVFRGSAQLVAFLRFIVESVLQGKQDRIKAYTIGVEVFRRNTNFDPQIDPIVRVEATRLRRTIERYYGGPGADDPIVIDLLRGSYVPTICCREATGQSAVRPPHSFKRSNVRSWPAFSSAIVLATMMAAIVTGYMLSQGSSRPDLVVALHPGNGMPNLIVEPLVTTGSPGPRAISSTKLFEKIHDVFSRFDDANIASQPLRAGEPDYRFQGSIEYHSDDATSIRFRLLDLGEGNVVWAKSFESSTLTNSYALSEDEIAGELAGTLLWIYGVISSHERIKHLSTGTGDARYRCLLEAFDAIRSYEPDITNRALACLEHLTFVDPSFAEGFSFLSILYNREYLFGSDTRKIGLPGPDRILQTARRAVELTPASAHAHIVLAVVLFGRHEDIAALAAADEALSLNKYDPLVVSEYGGRLILSGQIETGMNMMLQATDDSVVRPLWHHFYLFLGNYLLGKMEAAASQANLITSNTYQLELIARALVSARNGDHDKARQALERLVALRPAWRDNLRGQLEKFISAPAIVDRLARDLVTAGLPGKH